LSGEVAAVLGELGTSVPFARVTAGGVLPYAPRLERYHMPSVQRIVDAARCLL
jgi:hypothetical protein